MAIFNLISTRCLLKCQERHGDFQVLVLYKVFSGIDVINNINYNWLQGLFLSFLNEQTFPQPKGFTICVHISENRGAKNAKWP